MIFIEGVDVVVGTGGINVEDGVETLGNGEDTEDSLLVFVEGVGGVTAGTAGARSEVVDGIEAVAVTAPAPKKKKEKLFKMLSMKSLEISMMKRFCLH